MFTGLLGAVSERGPKRPELIDTCLVSKSCAGIPQACTELHEIRSSTPAHKPYGESVAVARTTLLVHSQTLLDWLAGVLSSSHGRIHASTRSEYAAL